MTILPVLSGLPRSSASILPYGGRNGPNRKVRTAFQFLTRQEAIRFTMCGRVRGLPVHPSTPSNRTTTSKTFKVLTCERLQNLVNAIAFFTAVELGTRIKLDILSTHLMTAAKCLLGAGAQIPSLSIRQRTTAPAATLRLIFCGRSWLKGA